MMLDFSIFVFSDSERSGEPAFLPVVTFSPSVGSSLNHPSFDKGATSCAPLPALPCREVSNFYLTSFPWNHVYAAIRAIACSTRPSFLSPGGLEYVPLFPRRKRPPCPHGCICAFLRRHSHFLSMRCAINAPFLFFACAEPPGPFFQAVRFPTLSVLWTRLPSLLFSPFPMTVPVFLFTGEMFFRSEVR